MKNKASVAILATILLGTLGVALKNAGPPRKFKQDAIDIRRSGNVLGAFKLQAEPAMQSVAIGSPVNITVKLVNVSELSQIIEITRRPTSIYIVVRHSNGRLAELTDMGVEMYAEHIDKRPFVQRLFLPTSYWWRMRATAGSMAEYAVSDGGSQDFNIEVSRFYDMSQTDIYTVESEVPFFKKSDMMVENVVKVEVK